MFHFGAISVACVPFLWPRLSQSAACYYCAITVAARPTDGSNDEMMMMLKSENIGLN